MRSPLRRGQEFARGAMLAQIALGLGLGIGYWRIESLDRFGTRVRLRFVWGHNWRSL